jgi:hypothetical protein
MADETQGAGQKRRVPMNQIRTFGNSLARTSSNDQGFARDRDALHFIDLVDVDQLGRPRQPHGYHGYQGLPAGQDFLFLTAIRQPRRSYRREHNRILQPSCRRTLVGEWNRRPGRPNYAVVFELVNQAGSNIDTRLIPFFGDIPPKPT